MKKIISLSLLVITFVGLQAQAFEGNAYGSSTSVGPFTTQSNAYGSKVLVSGMDLEDLNNHNKLIVLEAKEDAAMFVASEGVERTTRMQQAFNVIRDARPSLSVSDFELALAISAIEN